MASESGTFQLGVGRVGEIYCTKEEFEQLRRDPLLMTLLELGRLVNQLMFFQVAVTQHNLSSPSAERQRLSAFALFAGTLHESVKVIQRMPDEVRKLSEFSAIEALLNGSDLMKIMLPIKHVRDKIAFHLDPEVMREGVERMVHDEAREEYVFAVLSGRSKGETYYKLANEAAYYFIAPQGSSAPDALKPLLGGVTEVALQLEEACEKLIVAVLKLQGWRTRIKMA
jgi:hypothetical protein